MAFQKPPPLDLTPVPGEFTSEWTDTAGTVCRNCGSRGVQYRMWESSDGAFEDVNYQCLDCLDTWWVDGPDS